MNPGSRNWNSWTPSFRSQGFGSLRLLKSPGRLWLTRFSWTCHKPMVRTISKQCCSRKAPWFPGSLSPRSLNLFKFDTFLETPFVKSWSTIFRSALIIDSRAKRDQPYRALHWTRMDRTMRYPLMAMRSWVNRPWKWVTLPFQFTGTRTSGVILYLLCNL